MNDFLDCCRTVKTERDDARLEADRLRAEIARIAKERDEAQKNRQRLECELHEARGELARTDRARDEVARLKSQCDEIRAEIVRLAREHKDATESAKLRAERAAFVTATAEPLKPFPDRAEVFEGLEKIEEIVSGTLRDTPGTDACDQCDPLQRLARIAVLTGRLAEAARGGDTFPGRVKVAFGLQEIAKILAGFHPSSAAAWSSLAEIGLIVGRLIAVTR